MGLLKRRQREPRDPIELVQGRRGAHCFPEVDLPDGFELPSAALVPSRPVPDADLREALISVRSCITTSARDASEYRVDAWLYAILVGWGCEGDREDPGHIHDDICGGDAAMREVAERHGWSPATVDRARLLRKVVAEVQAGA